MVLLFTEVIKIGSVGAILFLVVDKFDHDGPMARLLVYLLLRFL